MILNAQNIQHHWDSRDYQTTTIEAFVPGTISFYGFGDRDWNDNEVQYGEASLTYTPTTVKPTVQYAGGNAKFYDIEDIWLFGGVWKRVQLLYRTDDDIQVTYTWNFSSKRYQLSGFADLWGFKDSEPVLLSRPQAWVKLQPWLHVGSEIEVSEGFRDDRWKVYSTVAVKWQFGF